MNARRRACAAEASATATRRRGFSLLEVVIATAILMAVVTVVFLLLSSSTTESAHQSIHTALDNQARELLAQVAMELRLHSGPLLNPPPAPGPVGNPWWDAPVGSTRVRSLDLTINRATGVDLNTRAATSNTTVRYRWVRETFPTVPGGAVEIEGNNVDDDLDGIVDEGNIERTETSPLGVFTSIVCRDVLFPRADPDDTALPPTRAIGFWFEWDGAVANSPVTVKLTLQRMALVRSGQDAAVAKGNLRIERRAETTAARRN